MKLTADTNGHYVAVQAREGGRIDAGFSGDIAGLELDIDGELRVNTNERSVRGPNHAYLALSFSLETGRTLAVTLADRLGMPSFTESEWRAIATILERSIATHELAAKIREVYPA